MIDTSFTAPLRFRDNYFFVDSVPTFGKTAYLKRDSKKPRKSLGSNFRNSCSDGPFGPGRLQTGPPNQKLVSTESSLHALLQRCGLTRFSQIIKGWHEWVSRYQKTISGRHKSKKQRVTSIFAWVFITTRAEKERSVALGCITTLLQKGTTVPLPQTQVPTYSPHLMLYSQFIDSSAPSLLFAFLHASLRCKSVSVILRFPFKMQSDKFPR